MATTQKRQFNNISETLQNRLAEMKKKHGPIFRFKLLIGKEMNLPIPNTSGAFEKKTVYPSVYGWPCRDTIIDPETGNSIAIAVIKNWDDNDNPVFDASRFTKSDDEGRFNLNEKNPADLPWIDFFLLSNFLVENDNRSSISEPIINMTDEKKKAKEYIAKLDDTANTIVMAAGMTAEQRKNFAAALAWDETEDDIILKARIGEMAQKDTPLFKQLVESGQVEYRAVLKMAVTKGLVTHNTEAGTLSWNNGDVFATLDSQSEKFFLEQFAEWVVTHPSGQDVFKNMKKLIAKRN